MPDLTPGTPSVVAQAPQIKVGEGAFQRAPEFVQQVGIAPGLAALGSGAEDLAVPLAKAQAASDVATAHAQNMAVVQDPTGAAKVVTPVSSFILGRAGEEYDAAVAAGTSADMASAIRQKITDFHLQNPTDAAAFSSAAGNFAESLRQTYGGALGNQLADQAHNEATQHWGDIVETNAKRDVAFGLQSLTSDIDYTKNKMITLARQGAIGLPEYQQLQDHLNQQYDKIAANPRFGYSPDKIAAQKQEASAELNGQFVAARIDETFNKKGKAAALDAIRDQIDNNPALDALPLAQKNELHNFAMSRLSYLSTEAASNLAALKPTVALQVRALQAGNNGPDKVSDAELDQTEAQLRQYGAFKEAGELSNARTIANRTVAFQGLTPAQKAQALFGASGAGVGGPVASSVNSEQGALQYFQSQGWSPAQAAGVVGNLVHESGGKLNPAAINRGDGSDGSDSIGIGQWNGQRAADLKQFAAAQGKPWQDLGVQLAFVQHELQGSEGKAARMLKAASTAQDAAGAFALGYERPQGFQSGNAENVLGWQNRLDQTMRLAGGGASAASTGGMAAAGSTTPGVATLGQPYTDAEAQANPWIRTAYRQQIVVDDKTQIAFAKNQAATIMRSVDLTGTPSADIVPAAATVIQLANRYPQDTELGEQVAKMRGAIAGHPAGFAAAGEPDHGANLLSQAEEMARHGDLYGNSVYEGVKAGIKQGQDLLKNDQYEYARQAGWFPGKPATFNPADPATLPQQISQRAVMSTIIAAKQGLDGISIFSNAELPAVKDTVQHGTLDQKMQLLGAIGAAHLSQPKLQATMRQLAEDPSTSAFAVAGDVARFDPVAARSILQGQALKAADDKLAPNKDDFPTQLAQRIPFNDMPDGVERKAYSTAISAAYAKRSADAGDTTGVLDDERLNLAVRDATGGIVEWRGSKAIAPWYGASQDQFDAAIRTVTDKDLANSRGSDGVPLPASYLQPSVSGIFSSGARWRLETAGEGRYFVYAGADQHDQRQYLHDVNGGKFVLDLGAKRSQVENDTRLTMPSQLFAGAPPSLYETASPTFVAR